MKKSLTVVLVVSLLLNAVLIWQCVIGTPTIRGLTFGGYSVTKNVITDSRLERALLERGFFPQEILDDSKSMIVSKRARMSARRYEIDTVRFVAPGSFERKKIIVWCPTLDRGRVIIADQDGKEI